MLRKRIIPIVLLDGFSVLKTINFKTRRNLGSPITVLRTYNTRNVDELILLDIDATIQNRAVDKFTIADVAKDCFMPLTVGGGIKTVEDIRDLLSKGADKVSINSAAIKNPTFINEAASQFGSQCIVVSIDVVKVDEIYKIYNNGTIIEGLSLSEWINQIELEGAGEILINSVDKDGTMAGADIELASLVSSKSKLPVIYVGGISSPSNATEVAKTGVSGLGISSIFHFSNITPKECSDNLNENGILAR